MFLLSLRRGRSEEDDADSMSSLGYRRRIPTLGLSQQRSFKTLFGDVDPGSRDKKDLEFWMRTEQMYAMKCNDIVCAFRA